MRFMVIVKATRDSEAGAMPEEELFAKMGRYHEELAQAGMLLDASGLQPSAKGWRIKYSGDKTSVVDGPFPEADPRDGARRPSQWTFPRVIRYCVSGRSLNRPAASRCPMSWIIYPLRSRESVKAKRPCCGMKTFRLCSAATARRVGGATG